jgi:hypothetical protein
VQSKRDHGREKKRRRPWRWRWRRGLRGPVRVSSRLPTLFFGFYGICKRALDEGQEMYSMASLICE